MGRRVFGEWMNLGVRLIKSELTPDRSRFMRISHILESPDKKGACSISPLCWKSQGEKEGNVEVKIIIILTEYGVKYMDQYITSCTRISFCYQKEEISLSTA